MTGRRSAPRGQTNHQAAWSRPVRRRFLDALARDGNVSAACRTVKRSRLSACRLREADEVFRQEWDQAVAEAYDDLQAALRTRALDGVDRPVFYGGKPCGTIRHYSDSAGISLLRHYSGAGNGAGAEDEDPSDDDPHHDLIRRLLALSQGTRHEG